MVFDRFAHIKIYRIQLTIDCSVHTLNLREKRSKKKEREWITCVQNWLVDWKIIVRTHCKKKEKENGKLKVTIWDNWSRIYPNVVCDVNAAIFILLFVVFVLFFWVPEFSFVFSTVFYFYFFGCTCNIIFMFIFS